MEEINISRGDNSSRKILGVRGTTTVPGSSSCIVSNPEPVRFCFTWAIFVVYLFRPSSDVARAVILLLIITRAKRKRKTNSRPASKQSGERLYKRQVLAQSPQRGFRSTARHIRWENGRDPHTAAASELQYSPGQGLPGLGRPCGLATCFPFL